MYCGICGKPNPDSSSYCVFCGGDLTLEGAVLTSDSTADRHLIFRQFFGQQWCRLATSPLALCVNIFYTVLLLLNTLQMETMTALGSSLTALSEYSNAVLWAVWGILLIPQILICVGLWINYAQCYHSKGIAIKTAGLSLIRGTVIGVYAVCGLILLTLFFSPIGTGVPAVVILLSGFLVILMGNTVINFLRCICESARNCFPDLDHVMGTTVLLFAGGVFSVLALALFSFSFSLLVSAITFFLLGALLLKYKRLMEKLEGSHIYCNKCGKSNPDSREFCSACGTTLKTQGSTNTDPQFAWRQSFSIRFRYRWRELAASPLSLAMIICYCAAALLSVMQLNTAFEELSGLMNYIDLGFDLEGSIGVLQLLIIAPNALIAVGMWMLYADARQPADQPIKTTAIGLIRGTAIGYMVAYLCIIVLALFSSCSAMSELSGSFRAGLTGVILGLVLGTGLLILYYRVLLKLLDSVREVAENCFPDTEYITFVAVSMLVSGGIGLLAILISGITFPALVSVASTVLIGIVLLQYKKMMEELSGEYIREYDRSRDEAEKAASRSQRTVQTIHAGAEQRLAIRKPEETKREEGQNKPAAASTARFCPACGAKQTAQWRFCPECGFSFEEMN